MILRGGCGREIVLPNWSEKDGMSKGTENRQGAENVEEWTGMDWKPEGLVGEGLLLNWVVL